MKVRIRHFFMNTDGLEKSNCKKSFPELSFHAILSLNVKLNRLNSCLLNPGTQGR